MYGFRGSTISGVLIDKKGYKDRSHMRVAVKRYLTKHKHVLAAWYEYKIDKNGFRIIAEIEYRRADQ